MSRVFGGCRVLMAAVKAAGAKSAKAPPASKSSAASAKAKAASTATATTRPRNMSGIQKPIPVSPAMKEFLGGVPEISRAGAVKKIWEYIKLNDLQNPANKREVFCDEKLRALFEGRDKVQMLEVSKLLSPHFIKSG